MPQKSIFPTKPLAPEEVRRRLLAVPGFGDAALPLFDGEFCEYDSPWSAFFEDGRSVESAAAVAFLFVPPAPSEPSGEARVLITRRSTALRSYRGQIGFAGGRAEASESHPHATALRELHEEIGVDPGKVGVLGLLRPESAIDGSLVIPVLLAADVSESELVLQESEVDAVYMVPCTHLARSRSETLSFNVFGSWRESELFSCPGDIQIWGLTARIIAAANMRMPSC